MYCGQCGKKVMDNMLFCPFCGSPIVIPDQDEASAAGRADQIAPEPAQQSAAQTADEPALKSAYPKSLFDAPAAKREIEEPQEEFVPLSFDFEAQDEPEAQIEPPREEPQQEQEEIKPAPLDIPEEEIPARRPVSAAPRPQSGRKRPSNTYIPVKEIDPDDIFMDADDDYDLDEDFDDADDDDYYYEDREEGSFFRRHVRGLVALLLFFVLLSVCLLWATTDKGQSTLARFNLAWRADAYAELGYAAYQQDNDLMAARYYERALARDEDNYEYAHSAMVAYYEADQIEASANMLKRCIAMEPDNPEPYQELLILYPDAQQRPWEIKELIRQGYEKTGDASLLQ